MDFDWDSNDKKLFSTIKRFSESFFHERSVSDSFDYDGWQACCDQGILKITLPKENWDGQEKGLLTTIGAFETLGCHGADAGLLFALGAHYFGCCIPVSKYAGTEMQKEWGKQLASGEIIGALAVTEPTGGSSPGNMTTHAVEEKDNFIICGEKTLITNAPVADLFLLVAATKPGGGLFGLTAFLIPSNTSGIHVETLDNCLGLKGAAMGRIVFDNCVVPKSTVLGAVNSGFPMFTKTMIWERTGLLSGLLGIAQRDLDSCVRFANERHDEKGSVARHQAISHRIAEMHVRLETARLLVYRAAWAIDNDSKDAITRASMAKYQASEILLKNAVDSIRIQAGCGWADNQGTAACLRDAVGTLFASGTSEIQLNIIASGTGLKKR